MFGPPRRKREANRELARLGPNGLDVPVEEFAVRASINTPPVELRGGDYGKLYVSANHLGLTTTGVLNRVLVCERADAPVLCLSGPAEIKANLEIYLEDGVAVVRLPKNARRQVADRLERYGWPVTRGV